MGEIGLAILSVLGKSPVMEINFASIREISGATFEINAGLGLARRIFPGGGVGAWEPISSKKLAKLGF